MKRFFTLLIVLIGLNLNAQTTSDFENIMLEVDSFLNGSEGVEGYTSGNVFLPNFYDDGFGSWSGWAISNTTDVSTPGFFNQYSAITGSGVDGSDNYAVSYISSFGPGPTYGIIELEGMAAGELVSGFSITNATYPYLSMQDGDQFAKKFGGATGDDPDFLLVTIKKYLDGIISTDSVNFYLADFRFEDNTMDYIVDEWTYIDLTSLGKADSLFITMTSTDVGASGINTPLYFCVDNIITSDGVTSISELAPENAFEVFPNPTNDFIILKNKEALSGQLIIYDLMGKAILHHTLNNQINQIDLGTLTNGTYLLSIERAGLIERHIVVKQ